MREREREREMGSKSSKSSNSMKDHVVFVLASRYTTDACRDVFEKELEAKVVSTRTIAETYVSRIHTHNP